VLPHNLMSLVLAKLLHMVPRALAVVAHFGIVVSAVLQNVLTIALMLPCACVMLASILMNALPIAVAIIAHLGPMTPRVGVKPPLLLIPVQPLPVVATLRHCVAVAVPLGLTAVFMSFRVVWMMAPI
jgi:hypothetical protein